MRYLIHESQLYEARARCEYLYDVFKLYFLPGKPEGSYTPFIPVGSEGEDILFITGHANYVHSYLGAYLNSIPEKEIVITSCLGQSFTKYASKKTIYVPDIHKKYCDIRDGHAYGFDFKISDAELDFYNADGDMKTRIEKAYTRL